MSRVLVAGGAGFIGRHLCASLNEQGHRVTIVDNFCTSSSADLSELLSAGVSLIESDVQNTPNGQYDVIYNLASPASPIHYWRIPLETMWANALGTWRLLELARDCGALFTLASTSEAYGDPLEHPQRETYYGNVNPIGPRSCYDESKRFAESLTMTTRSVKGVNSRIVRIFNTYGPGMAIDDGRAIPSFITSSLRGEPIRINGSGEQTRSFCYVTDLVDGLVSIGLDPEADGMVLNLGNPDEITINETAQLVQRMTGTRSDLIHLDETEGDPKRRCPDITRVGQRYGWAPHTDLVDGLTQTIADIACRITVTTELAAD